MKESILELKNISKVFGDVTVIKNVNLEIKKGEFVTFLGPSGCGKTTLLRMIAGFYNIDKGDIFLQGKKIDNVPPHKRNTPMVFQEYALFPHMNVYENISYGLKLQKVNKEEEKKRVEKVLELMQLVNLEDRYPNQMSGGQQQRVAIARALVMNPDVLLLDEPLSNLDAKLRESVRVELRMIQQKLGINMIYVTHDQQEALSMSDKIVVLNKGEIHQYGTPREIYFKPKTKFVADFIGTTNFINETVKNVSGNKVLIEYSDSKLYVETDKKVNVGDSVYISMRPESVFITKEKQEDTLSIKGDIKYSMFLGEKVRYFINDKLGKEWIVDHFNSGMDILEGQVFINVDKSMAHLIVDK
ncbi:ABC transporter ATP-binding protein [Clostridium cochlearium]|uniref:ABC transporter ATP-binding protein n=1 Tax=Clostridium cochlearium TaxID=1494 RepID=UPI001459F52C|nr:ABC transporter ATP-binding protein [Clostridium cochlearium]NME96576.1 ABC transporter ATP-binding protein [Clostridium cochlearium]